MKNYLYLAAFISLAVLGCREESNPVNPVDDGSLVISGYIFDPGSHASKIYTATFPFHDTLLSVEEEINSDRSFVLKVPVPPTNYLSRYTPFNRISVINNDSILFIDSIRIADPDMKYIRIDTYCLFSLRINYSLQIDAARISPRDFDKEGDYYISHYYFDSETTVQGYHKFRVVTADSVRETITEFNVNTKIGWNKLITKFKRQEQYKLTYTVSNYASEQADWIIGGSGLFRNYKLF